MTEELMLDAYSEINANGVPYMNNATLVVGDGTMKVDFANGRAKVPASIARLVAGHPHVEIPGLDAAPPPPVLPVPNDGLPHPEEITDADAAADAADISDEVRLAMEHLEADGEDVPEVAVAKAKLAGFEARTADGQPRCQAAKADGTQCANPVRNGDACQIPTHQTQLAQS